MEILLQQTFTILTSSPGNLIYHLILAFAVMAAMQAIAVSAPGSLLGARRKRMLLGLGLVLGAQLLLFLASGLAWQGIISSRALLPPLDRAVILWSLGWTAWLWAFPEPERRVDMLMGVFSLATVILFLFAFSLWSLLEASMAFNQTDINLGWVALAVLIILVAVLFLLVRRPEGWGTGLTFLGIHLAGFAIHLVGTAPTEYFAPAVRLAQLCSFPLLFALAQRLTPRHEQGAPWQRSPTQEAGPADLDILATWLQLASYDKPEKMVRDLPRALVHTLQVDLCYLVSPPLKREEISISGGYDRAHSTEMPGFILKQSEIPALAEAIHKAQTLRLTQTDADTADLGAIAATAGLERSGNLLFIPLLSEKQPWGGILLLSPHSGDTWSAADPATLQPLLDSLVPMLQRSGQKAAH
ncbi:MAG: hypothetical protein GYA59_15720, partial [Chloroflexi bacterium]|nr:hypothetical protein [Chloroflexota bacterium]